MKDENQNEEASEREPFTSVRRGSDMIRHRVGVTESFEALFGADFDKLIELLRVDEKGVIIPMMEAYDIAERIEFNVVTHVVNKMVLKGMQHGFWKDGVRGDRDWSTPPLWVALSETFYRADGWSARLDSVDGFFSMDTEDLVDEFVGTVISEALGGLIAFGNQIAEKVSGIGRGNGMYAFRTLFPRFGGLEEAIPTDDLVLPVIEEPSDITEDFVQAFACFTQIAKYVMAILDNFCVYTHVLANLADDAGTTDWPGLPSLRVLHSACKLGELTYRCSSWVLDDVSDRSEEE